jgi:hypothetical protein
MRLHFFAIGQKNKIFLFLISQPLTDFTPQKNSRFSHQIRKFVLYMEGESHRAAAQPQVTRTGEQGSRPAMNQVYLEPAFSPERPQGVERGSRRARLRPAGPVKLFIKPRLEHLKIEYYLIFSAARSFHPEGCWLK